MKYIKSVHRHGSETFLLFVKNDKNEDVPIVDKSGKFVKEIIDFSGLQVKAFSDVEGLTTDEQISIKLKKENKAFDVKKYEHSYPHCWRTDKPILYYPLDSWFIKTTAYRDKLVQKNKEIASSDSIIESPCSLIDEPIQVTNSDWINQELPQRD